MTNKMPYSDVRVIYNSQTKDFALKQVFYTKKGKIFGYRDIIIQAKDTSPKHLKSALSKPVLLEKNEKLKELLPKSKN